MSDLDKLFPDRDVQLPGGEKITVRPLFFGQLPKAVKLLRPITEAIRSAGIAAFDGKDFSLASDWPLKLPQLMDEGGEGLIEFVAFATSKPRAWFDTIGADDGIALTKAVFEVNGDFFVARVAPMLGMSATPKPTGATSLPDSYLPATAGSTSSASL